MFAPEPMAFVGNAISSPAVDQAMAFAGGQRSVDLDMGAWFGVLPRASSYEADTANFGFNAAGSAIVGGFDQKAGALSYGVAFSLEGTSIVQQTTGDIATVGMARVGGYAGYDVQNWTITGATALGLHRIGTQRLSGLTTAAYGAATGSSGVEAKGTYDVGEAVFEPFAGVVLNVAANEGFTEAGPLAIAGQASLTRSLETYTGARLSMEFTDEKGRRWTPEARVRLSYDWFNDPRALTASFVGVPGPFTLNGIKPSALGVKLGGGLTVDLNDRFQFTLGYDAAIRGAAVTHTAMAKGDARF
jgi:outer membrane autotransporter protein